MRRTSGIKRAATRTSGPERGLPAAMIEGAPDLASGSAVEGPTAGATGEDYGDGAPGKSASAVKHSYRSGNNQDQYAEFPMT